MAAAIVISILANASQANATLSKTTSLTQRVGGGFRKMAVPAVAAIGVIGAAAKSTIDAASDLSENVTRNGVIFGDQAKEIEKFAARAEQALGQSKTAALDAAATFGTIGSKAGLSAKDTADFSKQFVTLSSDLASFNNTSPEEAVTAIGAAMRGESEPIRKYGVMLDDATLRNRALKLGLIDSVKTALTPQQKALAASKEILAQTSKAQGDFARTSDGAANKSRILTAQQENLRAKIGSGLLPVYVKLQTILATVIAFLGRHQKATKIVAGVIVALAVAVLAVNAAMAVAGAATAVYTAVTGVCTIAQKAATAASLGTRIGLAALTVQTIATSAAAKAAAAAQWLLNVALTANPIGLVILAIVALVAILAVCWAKSERFRAIVTGAFEAVRAGVSKAVAAVVGFVKRNWDKLLVILTGPIGLAAALIIKHWSKISGGVSTMYAAVRDKISAMIRYVRGIPGKILDALSGLGDLLKNAGRSIINGLISGITDRIDALKSKLSVVTNLIPDFKGPMAVDKVLLRPAGQAIMDGLIGGIEDRKRDLRSTLGSITRTVGDTNVGTLGGVDFKGRPQLASGSYLGGSVTNVYNVSVKFDANMTEAQMGQKYASAIRVAKRQGLVPA